MCSFEQINFKSKISLLDTGDQSTQSYKYHPSRSFSWDVTKKHWNFHVNNISNFFHVSCLIGSALVLHLVFWSPRSKDKTQESKAFHNLNWCNFSIRKSKQREVWIIFTYTISKSLCYLENWDIFILCLKSVDITLMQTETMLSITMVLQVLSIVYLYLSPECGCRVLAGLLSCRRLGGDWSVPAPSPARHIPTSDTLWTHWVPHPHPHHTGGLHSVIHNFI